MANIVLFRGSNSPGMVSREIVISPPWALLHISMHVPRDRFSVVIIDGEITLDWLSVLKREVNEKTLCIGISSMTGPQLLSSIDFAREARKLTAVPIVWGGVHSTIFAEKILDENFVDIVVIGEGELSFPQVVQALAEKRDLSTIEGIAYRKNGEKVIRPPTTPVDFNEFPEIPYDLINVENYITKGSRRMTRGERAFELHTGRGCLHRCKFCYTYNKIWRGYSSSRVLQETEKLVSRYRLDAIYWREDNFFFNRQRVEEICKGLIKQKLNLTWAANCRLDYICHYDDGFIKLLKDSGLVALTMGAESGSDRVLNSLDKGIKVEEILKANRILRRHGISAYFNFLFATPGETQEDVVATLRLIDRLKRENPGVIIFPAMYAPYSGTALYQRALEHGFLAPASMLEWAEMSFSYLRDNKRFPWLHNDAEVLIKTFLPFVKSNNPLWRICFSAGVYFIKWRSFLLFLRFLSRVKKWIPGEK